MTASLEKAKKQKHLIVVVGPTAVGKTATAVKLAQHFQCEILSADSRQFYQEMNIGTAKPTKEEMQDIPHHFINNLSVHDDYSAGQFEIEALQKLDDLYQKHNIAIAVGGSGLFINALCFGLDDIPSVQAATREKWNQEWENKGAVYIQDLVQKIDPVFYAQVDIQNKHRLLRALEVWEDSGKLLSDIQNHSSTERDFELIFVGLNDEREKLYERINQRVDQMMNLGLLEEVQKLEKLKHLNPLKTVGYQEFFEAKSKGQTTEEAVELVKRNSRRYAKRQITWFKKTPGIEWFTPFEFERILEWVDGRIK